MKVGHRLAGRGNRPGWIGSQQGAWSKWEGRGRAQDKEVEAAQLPVEAEVAAGP